MPVIRIGQLLVSIQNVHADSRSIKATGYFIIRQRKQLYAQSAVKKRLMNSPPLSRTRISIILSIRQKKARCREWAPGCCFCLSRAGDAGQTGPLYKSNCSCCHPYSLFASFIVFLVKPSLQPNIFINSLTVCR